jgi:transcriptional/translational regulatory protein YebC/TACO1
MFIGGNAMRKKTWYTIEAEYKSGDTTDVVTEKCKTKAYKLRDELMQLDDIKEVTVNHH